MCFVCPNGCISVSPFSHILYSHRPIHYLGTLQTCHCTTIHQMHLDVPICPHSPWSSFPLPAPTVYLPISTCSLLDRQCSWVPLLSRPRTLNPVHLWILNQILFGHAILCQQITELFLCAYGSFPLLPCTHPLDIFCCSFSQL